MQILRVALLHLRPKLGDLAYNCAFVSGDTRTHPEGDHNILEPAELLQLQQAVQV
jgi:hypothetical protein